MNYLLIETSASICSVALALNSEIICSYRNDEPMQHATLLPRYVEQALAETRKRGASIDVVAVSGGPGSYTGLRIGVSTAKGLCYTTGAKLVQVSTLRLIALRFINEHPEVGKSSLIHPMIDARRMEVYTQAFGFDGKPCGDAEAKIVTPDYFVGTTETPLYICGSGAAKCEGVVCGENVHIVGDVTPIADTDMLFLAKEAVTNGKFEDVAYYEPFYLKEFYTTAKPISQ
ncbi:MAG: tRNA (adenosine(37)-N6)-threonylcarbamoyltransferase complex dimerization subunit type 1 TsaB [Paludibacteraceae bacterium]|nr:tRNA (adenosine(37)-N6)-threonylcarbamoyltransferase complex dimerization subunit type 1 TsaB [Paludibacteraceae bacterium]